MSKEFKVYPHKGFLNTEFCFYSENDNIQLVDKIDGSILTLPKGDYTNMKLEAGEHEFVIKGDTFSQKIIVEDAWRFGGSEIKFMFCSETSPWVACVMKDRMYFHNMETQEEFIENGLAPDSISDINGEYFLFQSNDGVINSIYSCKERKEIDKFTNLLYNNDGNIIFTRPFQEDVEEIGHWHIDEQNEVITAHYKGTEYTIADDYLYIKGIDNEYLIISIDDPKTITTIPIHENALCLIQNSHYAINLIPYYNREFDVQIFDLKNNCVFSNQHKEGFIESINDYQINEMTDVNNAFEDAKKFTDKFPNVLYVKKTYSTIEYFVWHDQVFCLDVTTTKETNEWQRSPVKRVYRIIDLKDKKVIYESNSCLQKRITANKLFIFEDYPTWTVITYETFQSEKIDNIKFCPYHHSFVYIRHCGDTDVIYNVNDDIIMRSSHKLDYDLMLYGVIRDKTVNTLLHLSCNNKNFERYNYNSVIPRETDNCLFCKGKDSGVVLMAPFMEHILYCPLDVDYLTCNISAQGNRMIGVKNGEISVYSLCGNTYECIAIPWPDLFDKSQYNNAWFDVAGNCFLFDEKEKVYKYYNCITDEIDAFEAPQFVADNKCLGVNTYRPLMDLDSHRCPVFKNPYNLQPINAVELSKLSFVSPDGRYVADNNYTIKYRNKACDCYITYNEYYKIQEAYDSDIFHKPDNAMIARRQKFVNDHREYFSQYEDISTCISQEYDFTSLFIDNTYFLRVQDVNNDEVIELPLFFPLKYLNYISFSFDSKFLAIAGLRKTSGGVVEIFDIKNCKSIYFKLTELAAWLVAFNKKNLIAYYTSTPNTNIFLLENFISGQCHESDFSHTNRSFLTFSPSGKYFALSEQGYTPYGVCPENWGHKPSCDIYIHKIDNPDKCLAHYNDHGSKIIGVAYKAKSVASVAFSQDEKKLLSVSNDGVVIVRNLNLLDNANIDYEKDL